MNTITKIRRARGQDYQIIIDIFNQAVDDGIATDETHPVTITDRKDWFAQFNDRHPLWVITINGIVVGWCALEHFYPHPAYQDSVEISIYIRKCAHCHGFGRSLLNFADQQIRQHLHFKTVIAYIYERNLPSQGLFNSCHYEYWEHLLNISKVNGIYRELKIFGKITPNA